MNKIADDLRGAADTVDLLRTTLHVRTCECEWCTAHKAHAERLRIHARALAAQPGQGEPLPSDDEPLRYLINLCHARPNMTSAAMIAELRAVYAAPPTPAHDRECRWCGSKPATNTCCSTARLHGQLAPTPDLGSLIHYPEHWDTAAYPTLADALREIGCSECRGLKRPTPDEAGARAKLLAFADFLHQLPDENGYEVGPMRIKYENGQAVDGPWWVGQDDTRRWVDLFLAGYRAALLGETK